MPAKKRVKTSFPWKLPVIIVLVLAVGGIAIKLMTEPSGPAIQPAPEPAVIPQETRPQQQPVTAPRSPDQPPATETDARPQASGGQVEQQPVATLSAAARQDPCEALTARIRELFTYLDEQPYTREYQYGGSMQSVLGGFARKLLENQPVIVQEDRDIFVLARNTAHLFRILGAKNLLFLKSILQEERGRLEHDIALLYRFTVNGCTTGAGFSLPFAGMYDYAAFFLTTVGGRSYLFRRQPDLRFLVEYYSLLIVDEANNRVKNRYGIDILEMLPVLRQDLQQATSLENREEYQQILDNLQRKYQENHGA